MGLHLEVLDGAPVMKKSSRYVGFRAPDELIERAKQVAEQDRRSLSNYIVKLIEDDLRGSGVHPEMDEFVESGLSGGKRDRSSGGGTSTHFSPPQLIPLPSPGFDDEDDDDEEEYDDLGHGSLDRPPSPDDGEA